MICDLLFPRHLSLFTLFLNLTTKGLILLTSDGRLPNAVLRGMNKQPKVYEVEVDIPITDRDIQRLRVRFLNENF